MRASAAATGGQEGGRRKVMAQQKIYADFHNLDDSNGLRLTCAGTAEDLKRQGIELREGLVLTFYMDDGDDRGEPDEILTEGVVNYDERESIWVASVDWAAAYHASDTEENGRPGGTEIDRLGWALPADSEPSLP
jgi:hypothetical protein